MLLTSASMLGLASLGMIVNDRSIALALSKVSVLIHASLICSGVASGTLVSSGAGDPLVGHCDIGGLFGGTNILQGRFHSLY